MNSSPPRVFLLNVFEKAPTGNARNVVHWLLRHSLEPGKWSSRMNVETIRALWRGVDTARAGQFEDAVKWFDVADTCAVRRGRRARWNLDAVLRSIIPASRGYSAEPTMEAVWELEKLLLSKAQPGCSRRLFDGLWKRWCIRAHKSHPPWVYQLKGK